MYVLIPFALEYVWIFQLYGLVQSSDVIAQKERKEVEIIEQMNELILLTANSYGSISSYLFSGSTRYYYSLQDSAAHVYTELNKLEFLAKDDPDLEKDIQETRALTNISLTQLQTIGTKATGESVQRLLEMRELMKVAMRNLANAQTTIARSKARLEEFRKTEMARRDSINSLIVCGLIGNLLLAIYFIFVFTRNITNRLARLVANARRLPDGQELPYRVEGGDEIAFLDHVLHDASDRLIAASEFRKSLMQMVAHDLRSPLMSCQVAVEIMASEHFRDDVSDRARLKLQKVKASMMKLMGLVEDLLMIEKLEAGKLDLRLEPVQISALVDDALETLSELARSHQIKLVNDCSPEIVSADKTRVLQIITNYLSNAIKFSPDSTDIRIYNIVGDSMRVCVEDHGRGLQPAELSRLFQKFQQSKSADQAKGFGLGLAICKLLAESHGGQVGADSEFGKGSTFWFQLPMGGQTKAEPAAGA